MVERCMHSTHQGEIEPVTKVHIVSAWDALLLDITFSLSSVPARAGGNIFERILYVVPKMGTYFIVRQKMYTKTFRSLEGKVFYNL